MRRLSISGVRPLFEPLENRLLLSASVHHAVAHHAVPVKTHVAHAVVAKKPLVKTTAATAPTTLKGDPIFMKFGSINGEVTLKGYEGDIQLNSFQWGVSRTIGSATGGSGDREAGAPSVSEITITKSMDKTSPLLLQQALAGPATPEVDIFFVESASRSLEKPGQPVTYAEYVLSDVLVSSYKVSSGGDRPTESITLNFTKVKFNYVPTGSTTPISVQWNLATAQAA